MSKAKELAREILNQIDTGSLLKVQLSELRAWKEKAMPFLETLFDELADGLALGENPCINWGQDILDPEGSESLHTQELEQYAILTELTKGE